VLFFSLAGALSRLSDALADLVLAAHADYGVAASKACQQLVKHVSS
jgi:hypothetical protein